MARKRSAGRRREGGRLILATWEEADAEVAAPLRAIVAEHGPDAMAIYLGNPNVHTLSPDSSPPARF